jgi:hypothetical protein
MSYDDPRIFTVTVNLTAEEHAAVVDSGEAKSTYCWEAVHDRLVAEGRIGVS